MATFLYKTRARGNLKDKPRVYFTCHPEDFDPYFEKIKEDIFNILDCVIYYTEDMTEVLDEENLEADLGQMNLFVVPVTFRLLTQPNRAMDRDIAYAKENKIPILPFMMESDIDEFYSCPGKFGERQYLSPYGTDATAICYADKLKKHLQSLLVSDEMVRKIRAAFDAYIFLSYRKKDRCHANALMKMIHKNPECRDIAIWYDEFLTPGESFNENIKKALENSELFALVVTPNLLEEPNGKPNYVMAEEYPMAVYIKKDILPAEMETTARDALQEKFVGIPACVDPKNEGAFKTLLLQYIKKHTSSDKNHDPEHIFHIGLAYLDGIDVEVDHERGMELISASAEAGLPEAMQKLYDMYSDAFGVDLDYNKALIWAQRLVDYSQKHYGEDHPDSITALHNLAVIYGRVGYYTESMRLHEKVHASQCLALGETHPDTLISLNEIAAMHLELGEYETALLLHRKIYTLLYEKLGKEHDATIHSLTCLAIAYGNLSKDEEALRLIKEAYNTNNTTHGETHPHTIETLSVLAYQYEHMNEHKKANEILQKLHGLCCQRFGKDHPKTKSYEKRLRENKNKRSLCSRIKRRLVNMCFSIIVKAGAIGAGILLIAEFFPKFISRTATILLLLSLSIYAVKQFVDVRPFTEAMSIVAFILAIILFAIILLSRYFHSDE